VTSGEISWSDVAERLASARSYWLGTCDSDGSPHAVPVWGAVVSQDLFLFSERRTAKARYVARNPNVVVHLESTEDVVIVNGLLQDLGLPQDHPNVLQALEAKYSSRVDAQYLPSTDADFDVLWRLRARRAMLWTLDDYERSQSRWRDE
jgi:hypothetical protein